MLKARHNRPMTWHNRPMTWHNRLMTWHNRLMTWHNRPIIYHSGRIIRIIIDNPSGGIPPGYGFWEHWL